MLGKIVRDNQREKSLWLGRQMAGKLTQYPADELAYTGRRLASGR